MICRRHLAYAVFIFTIYIASSGELKEQRPREAKNKIHNLLFWASTGDWCYRFLSCLFVLVAMNAGAAATSMQSLSFSNRLVPPSHRLSLVPVTVTRINLPKSAATFSTVKCCVSRQTTTTTSTATATATKLGKWSVSAHCSVTEKMRESKMKIMRAIIFSVKKLFFLFLIFFCFCLCSEWCIRI